MKYVVVIESTASGYSAFSPDLAGCVATGATRTEVERRISAAIGMHLEGLRADGEEVPAPRTYAHHVDVPA